jgi:hypothetical protein
MIKQINQDVIPNKLITSSRCNQIKITDDNYIIKEFEIHTNDKTNQIEMIKILNGKHPNCDPFTNVFCIPECLKRDVFNDQTLNKIVNMLMIFNFESAYYRPWYVFDIIKNERR